MSKFETSDQKSLKVKTLKPTTKVVAISHSSKQRENEIIKRISFTSLDDGFFREINLYPDVDFSREGVEYSYKAKDIFFEISFVDGFRFSCRCAEGALTLGVSNRFDPYVTLSGTGKFICTGNSSDVVELRNHLRNNVPIFGTFATGFDEKGVRCVFNNTDVSINFNDSVDIENLCLDEDFRTIVDRRDESGQWYFVNNAVRWC